MAAPESRLHVGGLDRHPPMADTSNLPPIKPNPLYKSKVATGRVGQPRQHEDGQLGGTRVVVSGDSGQQVAASLGHQSTRSAFSDLRVERSEPNLTHGGEQAAVPAPDSYNHAHGMQRRVETCIAANRSTHPTGEAYISCAHSFSHLLARCVGAA